MPYECVVERASCDIPETDSVICAAACDRLSIGAERHAIDHIRMPSEGDVECICCDIPELEGAIRTDVSKSFPIRTEHRAWERHLRS